MKERHSQHVVAHYFLMYWHNQSIHSFWVKQAIPDILPSSHTSVLLWDPEVFPGHMRYIIPPAAFGLTPGSLPSSACLENLQREMARRQPNLTSIVSFWHAGAEALLWDPSPSSSLCLYSWAQAPFTGNSFQPCFQSLPRFHHHRWGLDLHGLVNWKLSSS